MPNLLLPIKTAKKEIAIATLAEKGTVRAACTMAGISFPTHYNWLKSDPEYAAAVKMAEQLYADRLEEEADRRAVEGVDKPIYYKGQRVDTIKEYSDTLLIFKLKGARPEKYKDSAPIMNINGPVQFVLKQETLDTI